MKILSEYVRDILDTAAILEEQANQLKDLAAFFGGIVPEIRTGIKPEVKKVKVETKVKTKVVEQPQIPEVKKEKVLTGAATGTRHLSKIEKDEIRNDWNALGEHLRTKENRAALALKHSCSVIQVFSLTRGPDYYKMMSQARKQKKIQQEKSQTA